MTASAHAPVSPATDEQSAPGRVAAPVVPARSRLRVLGLGEVDIRGGFWGDRQQVNSKATLGHIEHWLEREGWLGNFDLAAAGDMSQRHGREFSDSEVYKLLEAMAWELGRRADHDLEARFSRIVARVAAAQEADGYIGTKFGRPGQSSRYSDLEWGHELYVQGHLIQAAVARARTGRPDDELVGVARRSADHICATFGPDGIQGVCGHAEIEVALAELGRVTGDRRYTDQAALFVERRGNQTLEDIEFGRAYYQDDVPVRDAVVFRGHAVRANYLAAGAVDVAVDTDDEGLLEAVARQWRNTRARRTYITGGQGSQHQDEGFGEDFMLPPDRAYSETCAAIASNMVSWRLLLETGEPQYADAMERTLYNVVATSPAEDGRSWYYANTLHQRVPGEQPDLDAASARATSSLRAPWFHVSCCLPNVARTLASLAAYLVTADDEGIQIHQYAPMQIDTVIGGGRPVRLEVETDYPRSGRVVVRVLEAPTEGWRLSLRIPQWSRAGSIAVGGAATVPVQPGLVTVDAPVGAGDEIVLELDMAPHFLRADPRIDAVRGCVAVERGPEIWCLESVDLPVNDGKTDVSRVCVDSSVAPRFDGSRVVVSGHLLLGDPDEDWPYDDREVSGGQRIGEMADLQLVPYHGWARRGPSTMRVWIPHA